MNTPTPSCFELSCTECDARTAALTAERDQLRADLERADALYQRACEVEHELRAEVKRFKAALEDPQKLHAHCLRTLNEGQIAHLFGERVTEIVNRAERAEAAETVALAKWNGALERALKAEGDLAALAQCHDDNCRAVVKIAAELTAVTAERDELQAELERADASYQRSCEVEHELRAELAKERARLNAGTILLTVAGERVWHCGVDLRAAIDAGMKEGAK
jgi:hypothetical protein